MPDPSSITTGVIEKKTGYHHGNLPTAIIEAVSQLIDRRRSLDFQLKEVAARVGTTPAAIYKHFASKQALLVETAVVGYDLQKAFRDQAMDASADAALDQLLALGRGYIRFARRHPGFFLLIKGLETEEILSSKRYQKQRFETVRLIQSLVKRCVAEGYFIDIDTELAMAALQAAALGLAYLYVGDQLRYVAPSLTDEEDLDLDVFGVALAGLLSAKGRAHLAAVQFPPL